jgi:TPR repeat protein
MGKKGKRSTKTGDGKAKQGPGKARRERAAAMKEIQAGVEALIERLERETKDKELFGPLTEREECPVCFLPMPYSDDEIIYMDCCGHLICGGCVHASTLISKKIGMCAFCRSESTDVKESVDQLNGRAEKNDVQAIDNLAAKHLNGEYGLPKDEVVALRLYLRAAELGHLSSIFYLAKYFYNGDVHVPQDAVFAKQFATIAARKGDLEAYYLLGLIYQKLGDAENAVKSCKFAARSGQSKCMEFLQTVISGDELEAIEEAYKDAVKVTWSEEREAYKKFLICANNI